MADAISKKDNSQTYLRQIQQEKAKYKRELMEAQRNDMKQVRDYYADQNKQLEQESAAAVVEIKQEARDMAAADRQERAQAQADLTAQRKADREQRLAGNSNSDASESSVEKKNLNSSSTAANKRALTQNYETKETDNFYRVQNRGSKMSEGAGYYTIDAYAPEHEKDNLRVSIQRNKAVISGQRKFQDEAGDDGKVMRTNNYQSFREEFKFNRPVSGEGMTRERIGDYVRFNIPMLEATEDGSENS
ncbi:MAG: Hsp20/alpha crystallin family protein [Pseudobdellovibrio sp.]